MSKDIVLVVSPHADDETLGCAGTLLKLKEQGCPLHWVLFSEMKEEYGYPKEAVEKRKNEIEQVIAQFNFQGFHNLGCQPAKIELEDKSLLISKMSTLIAKIKPNIIFIPYYNDIHTDHRAVVDIVLSCTKWFRSPSIDTVLFYETVSETDFNINTAVKQFRPNVFYNITPYIEKKIQILKYYESEISQFPFPRSVDAVLSLAKLRGSQSGFKAAEAFELLRKSIH